LLFSPSAIPCPIDRPNQTDTIAHGAKGLRNLWLYQGPESSRVGCRMSLQRWSPVIIECSLARVSMVTLLPKSSYAVVTLSRVCERPSQTFFYPNNSCLMTYARSSKNFFNSMMILLLADLQYATCEPDLVRGWCRLKPPAMERSPSATRAGSSEVLAGSLDQGGPFMRGRSTRDETAGSMAHHGRGALNVLWPSNCGLSN